MTLDSKDLQEIREVMEKELQDLKRDVVDEMIKDRRFREMYVRIEKIENLVDTEIAEIKMMVERLVQGNPR